LKQISLFTISVLACVLTGCVTSRPDFSKFIEYHPQSILVVPAFNKTTAADAPLMFKSTITAPLAERGYYVFPVWLTTEILLELGITDEGLLKEVPPQRFHEIFGADTILYVTILDWTTTYVILSSSVSVKANYRLVNAKTGEEIWNRSDTVVYVPGAQQSGHPIVMLIGALIEAAVATAIDYRPLAVQMNTRVFNMVEQGMGIPVGPYHLDYKKDYGQFCRSTAEQKCDPMEDPYAEEDNKEKVEESSEEDSY
jgi:hypothetical protein